MANRLYKFSFFLNALHFMNIEDGSGSIHPHTWQLNFYLNKSTDDFIKFTDVEESIQTYLSQYEGQVLNKINPFTQIEPSMENIGEVVLFEVKKFLDKQHWRIDSLEISENSTRTYVINTSSEDNLNLATIINSISENSYKDELAASNEVSPSENQKQINDNNIVTGAVKKKLNNLKKESRLRKIIEKIIK